MRLEEIWETQVPFYEILHEQKRIYTNNWKGGTRIELLNELEPKLILSYSERRRH